MNPVSEAQIRKAFINLSKGAASRANLPAGFDEIDLAELDFLGWQDPKAPARSYLVTADGEGVRAVGLTRSDAAPVRGRKSMCDLCLTVGSAVLMSAQRTGKAGQRGDSVGLYICSDLACSAFARGRRSSGTILYEESLTVEQKVERLMANFNTFLARITAP